MIEGKIFIADMRNEYSYRLLKKSRAGTKYGQQTEGGIGEPAERGKKGRQKNKGASTWPKWQGCIVWAWKVREREAHELEKSRVGGGVKSWEESGCQHGLCNRYSLH